MGWLGYPAALAAQCTGVRIFNVSPNTNIDIHVHVHKHQRFTAIAVYLDNRTLNQELSIAAAVVILGYAGKHYPWIYKVFVRLVYECILTEIYEAGVANLHATAESFCLLRVYRSRV